MPVRFIRREDISGGVIPMSMRIAGRIALRILFKEGLMGCSAVSLRKHPYPDPATRITQVMKGFHIHPARAGGFGKRVSRLSAQQEQQPMGEKQQCPVFAHPFADSSDDHQQADFLNAASKKQEEKVHKPLSQEVGKPAKIIRAPNSTEAAPQMR